mmetsp:Transcript_35806/g.80648  ORF Transcript_35806/g.80648 Transcript_35806/m.80648 type:complete len:259 (+) Transcript_35806:686-1462(+)
MYLSRSSGPLTDIRLRFPQAWAAALASAVFPHPGGPYSSAPLGSRLEGTDAKRGAYLVGRSSISTSSLLAWARPPNSSHADNPDPAPLPPPLPPSPESSPAALKAEAANPSSAASTSARVNPPPSAPPPPRESPPPHPRSPLSPKPKALSPPPAPWPPDRAPSCASASTSQRNPCLSSLSSLSGLSGGSWARRRDACRARRARTSRSCRRQPSVRGAAASALAAASPEAMPRSDSRLASSAARRSLSGTGTSRVQVPK